jgi:single-strand DNA-binding protein
MSRGINKVILIGTVGKDPEVRYTASGVAIASLSIATNEEWTDKTTNERKSKTEWHNLSFFGKLAEIVGEYVKKGGQIYVEGKLETRKWQDTNGVDRYSTGIKCNEMQMLGSKSENAGGQAPSQPPQQSMNQVPAQQGISKVPNSQQPAFDDFDSDLPF